MPVEISTSIRTFRLYGKQLSPVMFAILRATLAVVPVAEKYATSVFDDSSFVVCFSSFWAHTVQHIIRKAARDNKIFFISHICLTFFSKIQISFSYQHAIAIRIQLVFAVRHYTGHPLRELRLLHLPVLSILQLQA